jgi:hypothetical protein
MTLHKVEIYEECTRKWTQGHVLRETNTQNEKDDRPELIGGKTCSKAAQLPLAA